MKISGQKRQELFTAIHEHITDLRVKIQLDTIPVHQPQSKRQLDDELYMAVNKIWNDQKRILGITD